MAVSVGRVREDGLFDLKLEALVHNTIRGAAGAAILNAELLQRARPAAVIVMKFGGTSVGSAERIRGGRGARPRAAARCGRWSSCRRCPASRTS